MFVCVKCNRQMRPKKNGFEFVELYDSEPTALWSGDLWECQDCGAQVIYTDFKQIPIASNWQPNFTERSAGASVTAKPYTRANQKIAEKCPKCGASYLSYYPVSEFDDVHHRSRDGERPMIRCAEIKGV